MARDTFVSRTGAAAELRLTALSDYTLRVLYIQPTLAAVRLILNNPPFCLPTDWPIRLASRLVFMETTPLSKLEPATVARVTEFQVETSDTIRLKALGICIGRQIQLIRAGDPLILRVLGARVGISARLAAGIEVVADA